MNPFNLHQMTAAAGNCSKSEKGGRHGKACALAENLWTQMTFRIHAFSQEHKSAGAFLWRTGKSTGLWMQADVGSHSGSFRPGRTSGKFLTIPESVSSSIKWDSYLLGSCDVRVKQKNMQSSGPSSLCPHPILPTPEMGLCRALVELWIPNSPESLPEVLPGYSFLFLLLPSVSQQASPRSLLYLPQRAQ